MNCSEGLGHAIQDLWLGALNKVAPKKLYEQRPDMTSRDSVDFSDETKALLSGHRNSNKKYTQKSLSTRLENIKGSIRKFVSPKESKPTVLASESVSEKSAYAAKGLLAEQEEFLEKTGETLQEEFHETRVNLDKLKNVHESETISKRDKEKAEILLEKSNTLNREHTSLTKEQIRLANLKEFPKFEQSKLERFGENTRYHGSMSQKWNKDVEKLYEKNKTREADELKKSEAKKAKISTEKAEELKKELTTAQAKEKTEVHVQSLREEHLRFQKTWEQLREFQKKAYLNKLNNKWSLKSRLELSKANTLLERAGILQNARETLIRRPYEMPHTAQPSELKYYERDIEDMRSKAKQWQTDVDKLMPLTID
jgi:hypothetical protein